MFCLTVPDSYDSANLRGSSMINDVTDLSPLEGTQIATMISITAFWFFSIGAALGSFLNVVVYRLPLGMTLVRTPSACPSCGQPIEMRDNIPIFGWIKLRGRCRNCAWAIPVRYPLVEFAVASLFVILLFVELASGGANLPVREPEHYAGVVWTVWYFKYPDLMQSYFFHCLLLYLCLGSLLIALDRKRVPKSLLWFGIIVGVVWLAIEPRLHPTLGILQSWDAPSWPHRVTSLLSGLTGLVLGGGVGRILGWTLPSPQDAPLRSALFGVLLLCGLYLGPSTVLSVTLMTLLLTALVSSVGAMLLSPNPAALATSAVVAVLIQCLTWRQLTSSKLWPSHLQPWPYHAGLLAMMIMIAVLIRRQRLAVRGDTVDVATP